MKILARFCDLCAADGEVKLAAGWYIVGDGRKWDACTKHLDNLVDDWETGEYEMKGDVNKRHFCA